MTSTHPLFGAVFTAYNPPTAQFLSGQILRPVTDLLTALHTLERDASALITSIADYASNYALLAKYVDDDGRGSEAVRGSLADELGIPVVALREKVLVRLQKCVERLDAAILRFEGHVAERQRKLVVGQFAAEVLDKDVRKRLLIHVLPLVEELIADERRLWSTGAALAQDLQLDNAHALLEQWEAAVARLHEQADAERTLMELKQLLEELRLANESV